jgi:hypothetical protein
MTTRNVRIRLGMAVLAGAAAMLAPADAQAATANSTGGYSFDWSYGHRVSSCDNRSDSHSVLARWYDGSHFGTVIDGNGANNGCADSSYQDVAAKKHQSCYRGTLGESCGDYVYTGY